MRMRACVAGGLFTVVFLGFARISEADTKIAPREAAPGEPFTLVDAPTGRLVEGAIVLFRLGSITVAPPLRTHNPFKTAHGRQPADMYGGVYDVAVLLPGGVEIPFGSFTVIGAPPPPALNALYVLAAPPGSAGAHRIATGAVGAGGSLSFQVPVTETSGTARMFKSDTGLARSPDGTFLFVGHNESNLVEAFHVMADGSLVSTATAPVNTASDIEVHPTVRRIYAADLVRLGPPVGDLSHIMVFEYSALGALSLVQTIETAIELRGMAITADGLFLVTTHIGIDVPRHVDLYPIDASGNLAPAPIDSELPVEVGPPSAPGRLDDVAVDPRTATAYVKDIDLGIYAYSLVGGGLTPLNAGAAYAVTGAFLLDLQVGGDALFVLSRASTFPFPATLDVFTIQPTGELSHASSLVTSRVMSKLAVADEGSTLFLSSPAFTEVHSFSVTPSRTLLENTGSPFAVPGLTVESLGRLIVVQH